MSKPVLYSYFRSSASWRVRIALAHKGIDYDYKAVHLLKDGGQQNKDEYRSLNSMGQVPTLLIDGLTLVQSLPIVEYLDETRPENRLVPVNVVKRQQARAIAEMINSGTQPVTNLSVLQQVAKVTNDDAQKAPWAASWLEKGLKAVEAVLEKSAGKYCVGDEVTIADVALIPQLYNANRFKVDMTACPIIQRVAEECGKLEAFQKAHPYVQPDCPEDLKKQS